MMKSKNVAYAVRKLADDHGLNGGESSAWIATNWDGIEFSVGRGPQVLTGRISAEAWHRRGADSSALVDLVNEELARIAKEPQ